MIPGVIDWEREARAETPQREQSSANMRRGTRTGIEPDGGDAGGGVEEDDHGGERGAVGSSDARRRSLEERSVAAVADSGEA